MLSRVLEPEVMDTHEEALDYDSMNHRAVNELFVADFLELGSIHDEILDLGTGTALIPIELCQKQETVRVVATDMAASMLDLAKTNIEVAGLSDRILLDQVDAKLLPYDSGRFAAVISNTLIHHLPEPSEALAEAVRVTASGGRLFFRDLLRPPDDAAVKRLVYKYARDENAAQRQLFDQSLRAAFTLHEVRELIRAVGLDPKAVRTTSDRHWTWAATKT